MFTSVTVDSNRLSNVTPDKGHRKNLVTISPLQKYPIHQREGTVPHGSKPHYKGLDNSYTERSNDEEKLEINNSLIKYLTKTKKMQNIQNKVRRFSKV